MQQQRTGYVFHRTLVKVNEAKELSSSKVKQEVVVADDTGKATVVLWGSDINTLLVNHSYKLNIAWHFTCRSHFNKQITNRTLCDLMILMAARLLNIS